MRPSKRSIAVSMSWVFVFAFTELHPAMKHVAAVGKQLGFATIFNLLGPLCNPAGAKRQVLGVGKRRVASNDGRSAGRAWHGASRCGAWHRRRGRGFALCPQRKSSRSRVASSGT